MKRDEPEHGGWPFRPFAVAGGVRTFSEDVLVPGHPLGKDGVFLRLEGFRPRTEEDAAELLETYVRQARDALDREAYRLGEDLGYGLRCSVIVEVRGVAPMSGWILRRDNTLWLTTPSSGFVGG
jgi:hypothetical protein